MPSSPKDAFALPVAQADATPSSAASASPDKTRELQHAFALFNQVSAELTQAYEALQQRVTSLTAELAVANGELLKQYQEKQALSERLTQLVNALPAGVVELDGRGDVGEVNPAAIDMLGEGVRGASWRETVLPRFSATDSPDEWTLQTATGARRLQLAESLLPSSGGRIVLLHDITATYEMKASLERNQRLAAMGEMAASLAHQLRTPLSTALLYSANLATPDLSEEARTRFADRATEQLKRLERLIQDVLLFARGEQIGREVIALGAWLTEVTQTFEPLCRARGVRFELDVAIGDAVIVGGRKALAGALTNLLENALQASEAGARVALSARVAGGKLALRVSDSGPGIAVELRPRIFEPFFTTRGQGTGLGLAIALAVARAHGGTIEVSSEAGQGAEFLLTLPAGRPGEMLAGARPAGESD